MIWTIQAELFPSRYRAKGMALSTASNWIWNFLLAFFTPFITSAIDFRYGYVFSGCLLIAAAIVYFFVIESQGRTLEEIDDMYLQHVKPWKSSQYVPPSPEEMRARRLAAGTELHPDAISHQQGPGSTGIAGQPPGMDGGGGGGGVGGDEGMRRRPDSGYGQGSDGSPGELGGSGKKEEGDLNGDEGFMQHRERV